MLKILNIFKSFDIGTVNERPALSGVSLELEKGDFVTVIGSNGAGKSTLLNVIAGSSMPDSGKIYLDGEDVTYLPDYKKSKVIGRMFQDPLKGTAPGMSIEENLALAYHRASGKVSPFSYITSGEKEMFRERLSALGLGLEERMKQPAGLLSGGQRQALTLLMATLVTPKLLLLDEHTAALDPAAAERILRLTKDTVKSENITCIMVTHNIKSALELGNRTVMMNDGRVVAELKGAERAELTTEDLMRVFREGSGKALDSDRILLR